MNPQLHEFIMQGKPPIVISFSSMPLKNPNQFKHAIIQVLK